MTEWLDAMPDGSPATVPTVPIQPSGSMASTAVRLWRGTCSHCCSQEGVKWHCEGEPSSRRVHYDAPDDFPVIRQASQKFEFNLVSVLYLKKDVVKSVLPACSTAIIRPTMTAVKRSRTLTGFLVPYETYREEERITGRT